jgi:hypothetical protein
METRMDRRPGLFRRLSVGLALAAGFGFLAACAPIMGYPTDPENTDATLATLTPYFNGVAEAKYFGRPPGDVDGRTQLRNEIIFNRIHAYDITFADFERRLYGDGNGVTLGSDLAGLVLAGLTATTGTAATKAALGAASGGILGANTAINKDLYFNKTIPAMLAQMEANRLEALAPITAGLKLSDADYPLMQAYIDLDAYKNAGSIPAAITAINQNAANLKDAITFQRASAQAQLQGIKTVRAELSKLTTDAQFLALAKAMQPNLASRSVQIQNLVKTLDPNDVRLSNKPNNAKIARLVINAWVDNDDVSTVNQQQWLGAIAAASTAK